MSTTISIAELIAQGIRLTAHEAVAIAQTLITADADTFDARPPFGSPAATNLLLSDAGRLVCVGCAAKPGVAEVAILLQELLPPGGERVPGGLRYAIGRALLEVQAPPFDSVEDFSRALARFQPSDVGETLQALLARSRPLAAVAAAPALRLVDRRRGATTTDLRRQLRDADREFFEQHLAPAASAVVVRVAVATPPVAPLPSASPFAAAASVRTPRVVPSPVVATPVAALPVAVPFGAAASQERRSRWSLTRVPLAACFIAGVSLIAAGQFMQRRPEAPVDQASFETSAAVQAPPPFTPPPEVTRQPAAEVAGAFPSDTGAADSGIGPRQAAAGLRTSPTSTAAPAAKEEHTSEPTLARAAGSRTTPVFSPAFDSSGTAIFFHSGKSADGGVGSLMSTKVADGGAGDSGLRVMTIVDDGSQNYHVQPSPDGRQIAFDSDRDGERGVYVANRDGSAVRRVSGAGYAAVPSWSPDGRQLAFVRGEPRNTQVWNLWLLTLASGETRRLTNFRFGQTWTASWFPDGERICYTHEDELTVLNLKTGRADTFESPVDGRLVRTAAVSPDGQKVMFQVYRNGAWLLDMTDRSMRRVLSDPTAEEFAWAPDGRRVAFHSRRDGGWGIWIMSAAQ